MTIINEWVHSTWNTHFKRRTEIHHIYKLDAGTLMDNYPHLMWCFNHFNIRGLDNQTMTFDHYGKGRESYNFFRLSDTKMFMIHKTYNGNQLVKLVEFNKSKVTGEVHLETIYSERINVLDGASIKELNLYIKKHGTPKAPKKIYRNKNFNFAGSQMRGFNKLKGDIRKG